MTFIKASKQTHNNFRQLWSIAHNTGFIVLYSLPVIGSVVNPNGNSVVAPVIAHHCILESLDINQRAIVYVFKICQTNIELGKLKKSHKYFLPTNCVKFAHWGLSSSCDPTYQAAQYVTVDCDVPNCGTVSKQFTDWSEPWHDDEADWTVRSTGCWRK